MFEGQEAVKETPRGCLLQKAESSIVGLSGTDDQKVNISQHDTMSYSKLHTGCEPCLRCLMLLEGWRSPAGRDAGLHTSLTMSSLLATRAHPQTNGWQKSIC